MKTRDKRNQYVYKIKHIPSGLFYITIRGRFNKTRTNLGIGGKIYTKKPTIKQMGTHINISYKQVNSTNINNVILSSDGSMLTFKQEDFVIVRYKLVKETKKNMEII